VRSRIAVMIVVGKRNSASEVADARRLHAIFDRFHLDPPDKKVENATVLLGRLDTELQGTKLLGNNLGIEKRIAMFLGYRMIRSDIAQTLTWSEHKKNPYQ
jgi:hypothetical protein